MLQCIDKTWNNELLTFEFCFCSEHCRQGEVAVAEIYWNESPGDVIRISISGYNAWQSVEHRFANGKYIFGALRSEEKSEETIIKILILGNFYYGPYGPDRMKQNQHFDGGMVEWVIPGPPPVPPPPPPPCDPCDPSTPAQEFVVEAGDLFPYVYMRKWPEATPQEKAFCFVQYLPPSLSPPADTFYAELLKVGDDRAEVIAMALSFVNGQKIGVSSFLESLKELDGLIREFGRLALRLRSIREPVGPVLLAEMTEEVLGKPLEEIAAYLATPRYLMEKDQVWQSYFALVILPAFRSGYLEQLTLTLAGAHLLEMWLLPQSPPFAELTEGQIRELIDATILLPGLFPLPPYSSSLSFRQISSRGVIEPYAIGDLIMVRQRLQGYRPGEISSIENIMRGERREIKRRKRNSVEETSSDSSSKENRLDSAAAEGSTDLLAQTRATLMATTTYNNLQAAYSTNPDVTYNGNWTVVLADATGKSPAGKDMSRYAKEVLNRTVNRILQQVTLLRTVTTLNESEETLVSIHDNTSGTENRRGIYRWLNKVYSAWLVRYGNRFMLEFILKDPAGEFIESAAALHGISFTEPVSPANLEPPLGPVRSFRDIRRENYAQLAALYGVMEIQPPPSETKTASVTLRGNDEKMVPVPPGYVAVQAYAASTASATVLIGTNAITLPPSPSAPVPLNNQDTAVSVAMAGAAVASPPAPVDNTVVTLEITCSLSETVFTQWQINTYNSLLRGYAAQKEAYYRRSGTGHGEREGNPLLNREIERAEIRRGCMGILFERHLQKVGVEPLSPPVSPPEALVEEPRYVQFFEQSFEWKEMLYSFIDTPSKKNGYRQYPGESSFTAFLQAGLARVLVPVKPEFNLAALYYLSSGLIWEAAPSLAPCNGPDVDLCAELKRYLFVPPREELLECACWEVVVPTAMQVLQEGQALPVHSCGCPEKPCGRHAESKSKTPDFINV